MAFKWQTWQNIAAGLVGKASRSRKIRRRISDLIETEQEWRHLLLDMPTTLISRNAEQLKNVPILLKVVGMSSKGWRHSWSVPMIAFYLNKIASSNSNK